MAELEELEQEELDKNLLEISGPETVPLPNVPSVALPSKPGEYAQSRDTPWRHGKGVISWSVDFGLGSEPNSMVVIATMPVLYDFPWFSPEQDFLTSAPVT